MRSQVVRSSSSSEEIITTVIAALAVEPLERVEHQRFRADVDAAGRLGDKEELRLERECLGQANLLLVAAGELSWPSASSWCT